MRSLDYRDQDGGRTVTLFDPYKWDDEREELNDKIEKLEKHTAELAQGIIRLQNANNIASEMLEKQARLTESLLAERDAEIEVIAEGYRKLLQSKNKEITSLREKLRLAENYK